MLTDWFPHDSVFMQCGNMSMLYGDTSLQFGSASMQFGTLSMQDCSKQVPLMVLRAATGLHVLECWQRPLPGGQCVKPVCVMSMLHVIPSCISTNSKPTSSQHWRQIALCLKRHQSSAGVLFGRCDWGDAWRVLWGPFQRLHSG